MPILCILKRNFLHFAKLKIEQKSGGVETRQKQCITGREL